LIRSSTPPNQHEAATERLGFAKSGCKSGNEELRSFDRNSSLEIKHTQLDWFEPVSRDPFCPVGHDISLIEKKAGLCALPNEPIISCLESETGTFRGALAARKCA
jgi:hypothetical protein